ncbi:F-type conjugal transfer pilus assembly protein TraB [Serratia proteamaculans]|uniref:F-type conjugal transfer pilus assembly protein TraB n=1 Tax=Serratia proteamaculans TaxID=28151 RepID=UPI0039BE6B83
MASNINFRTKRAQLAILIGFILAAGAVTAGVLFLGQEQADAPVQALEDAPAPNMTGVVTSDFADMDKQSALSQQQSKMAAMEHNFQLMTEKMSQMENKVTLTTDALNTANGINQQLRQQLDDQEKRQGGKPLLPQTDSEGRPVPGQLASAPAPQVSYSISNPTTASPTPGQGSGFYPGGSAPVMTGNLKTTSFNYNTKKKKKLPYIFSGSFSEAIMTEGADANASVTGQQNTSPVQFHLIGMVSMPNGHELDLSGCFVTAEIWGDISSERGMGRTRAISCKLKNGTEIDQEFTGHFSYQGKAGIRGTPVMRNGMIIGYAGAAGFISGIGQGISDASTPSVGLGATARPSGSDVLMQGFGGGAEKTSDTLSQYWIKRAEQYHPVIDIGAGNAVTIVFQQGFQLLSLEESLALQAQQVAQTATEGSTGDTPVAQNQATTQVHQRPASTMGTLNPDEILRQAKELNLGDTLQ